MNNMRISLNFYNPRMANTSFQPIDKLVIKILYIFIVK